MLVGQRAEQLDRRHRGHDGVGVVAFGHVQHVRVGHLVPVEAAADLVDHEVAGDGEQPAAHRSLGLHQPFGVVPGADERLLHDVLREVVIVQQFLGVGEQRLLMLPDELAETTIPLGRVPPNRARVACRHFH